MSGYQRVTMAPNSPSRVFTRVCSNKGAPGLDHRARRAGSVALLQEWDWKEHFSPQPDTLAYLHYVADKFDLRRDKVDSWQTGVNRNVEGRNVRRVLGYNGNGVHFRRTTEEVATRGDQEFRFS